MNVGELIEELQQLDPTLIVRVPCEDPDDIDNDQFTGEVDSIQVGFKFDHCVNLWCSGETSNEGE